LAILAAGCLPVTGGLAAEPAWPGGQRPVLALVAFGTSVEKARQVYAHIEERTRQAFPGYEIRWGFTAESIVKKLREKGVSSQTVAELAAALQTEGKSAVVLQSLHVAPGGEFEELRKVDFGSLRKAYGAPLLSTDEDIEDVVRALSGEVRAGSVNVVVCHGNDKVPEFNRQLVAFAKAMEARHPNVVVASVEGQPGTEEPLKRARTMAEKTGAVHFIPLMIVAGDHIMNDVLGDEPDSWKNQVGAKTVTCSEPLGQNDAVLAVFHRHLKQALAELASQP
jgi:sirohydrochlorin cobaltochelatase